MKKTNVLIAVSCALAVLAFSGCETTTTVTAKEGPTKKVDAPDSNYAGLKRTVAIARFSNETSYAKGAFYRKDNDPMANQVMDILSTKLQESGKFILLERNDIELIEKEQDYAGLTVDKIGADYLIIGSITKYGRKVEGTHASVFGASKKQVVEAGVTIRLVDVRTGEVIYAESGEGEAAAEDVSVLGFGTHSGYDATLNDKAIEAAIESLTGNIIKNCTQRPWQTYIISADDDTLVIAGGKTQGIMVGDEFKLCAPGKKVKNPQTGLYISLPGKQVGTVTVVQTAGSGSNEYSVVVLESGSISGDPLKYEIFE